MNTNFKWTIGFVALVLAVLTRCARADESNPAKAVPTTANVALTPQQFVNDATAGNLKEVYLSELAMTRCTNAAIQDFAEHMIRDHRSANEKLAKIAQDEGLTCLSSNLFQPNDPAWNNPMLAPDPAMKGEEALMLITTNLPYYSDYRAVQMIRPLTGSQFQDAYVTAMNDDHVAAITEFETAAQYLGDAPLKKYAEQTLPTLRKHLEMAQHLKSLEFESRETNMLSQTRSQPAYTYPGMP